MYDCNNGGIFYLIIDNDDCVFKYLAIRRDWREDEKSAVRKHLSKFFATGKVPKKKDIDPAMKEDALRSRTWRHVKDFISHHHKSQQKKLSKKRK